MDNFTFFRFALIRQNSAISNSFHYRELFSRVSSSPKISVELRDQSSRGHWEIFYLPSELFHFVQCNTEILLLKCLFSFLFSIEDLMKIKVKVIESKNRTYRFCTRMAKVYCSVHQDDCMELWNINNKKVQRYSNNA